MPNRQRPRRRSVALLLALSGAVGVLASRAAPAYAQGRSQASASKEVSGVVLDIQGEELIIDLGKARGLSDGDRVEIWRPVKLKHPVTGALFTDRFLIGTLELSQVRPSMSLAKSVGTLSRVPQTGDMVIAPQLSPVVPASTIFSTPSTKTEPTPSAASSSASSPEEAEAVALGKMMDNLRGADPLKRIRVYEDYVRTQPKGRFARVLYEEAASLRRIYDLERQKASEGAGGADGAGGAPKNAPVLKSFNRPSEAVGGSPLRISVELSDEATGAILHLRTPGQSAYSSIPMAPMGSGYFGATIPAEKMAGSELNYFLEATNARGAAVVIVGTPVNPETVRLAAPPLFEKPKKRDAQVTLWTDYADYNVGEHNDWAWQTEGYFQLRYGDVGVRAVRSGFGVYRGMGGTVRDLDELGLSPRSVGLTYGYVETEVGAHKNFSFIGRIAVGLDEDGVAGGGQLLLRIGNDQQTNLVLGGELLGGVGLRGITQLELNTFPRFPMLFRIEVTNQPAGARASGDQLANIGISQGGGQVGGRGIAQIGWRIWDPIVVSLRGSFQGRTIKHAGPGGGAAVSYSW